MEQLTKPEILNGQKVVRLQLTAEDVNNIHEALVVYMRSVKNIEESSAKGIEKLRQEFKEVFKAINPS